MDRYASSDRTITKPSRAAAFSWSSQWEAKEGQADKVAEILARFCRGAAGSRRETVPDLQGKDNPAQFLSMSWFATRPRSRRTGQQAFQNLPSPSRRCRCWPGASVRNTPAVTPAGRTAESLRPVQAPVSATSRSGAHPPDAPRSDAPALWSESVGFLRGNDAGLSPPETSEKGKVHVFRDLRSASQ